MSRDNGAEGEYSDPRSLLASLSRSELERIIRERLDEGDAELGELILALHADKSDERSPSAIVHDLVGQYSNREYDRIGDPDGFARDLRDLYDRAAEAASGGDGLFAVQLLAEAIEGAAPHAFNTGDEEGEVMDAVKEGFERLMEIARSPESDPAALRELGTWAGRSAEARWARDGDSWDICCLELSSAAARGGEEVRQALALCSRFVDGPLPEGGWNYNAERGALVAAGLLARFGDEDARRSYIDAHLDLGDIRKLAVDEAMAAGDYGRAIELCRGRIGLSHVGGLGGSAEEFEGRLIEALDRTGDRAEATRELERFVVEHFSIQRYEELKSRIPERDCWVEARDRIIAALEGKGRSIRYLAAVYQAEDMSERLLALAEKDEYLFLEYLDTIGRAYPERAARFLKARIERELRTTAGRSSYAHSAEDILRYGTYAGEEAAQTLFDSLVSAYPSRRAMREEFAKARGRD